ncbi:MAG: sugar phosphate isomerase/epimerase family protein [Spirochaetia bacterium]
METEIAVNTDIDGSDGSPFPSIDMAAEAGFTHLTWGHQFNTDFMYSHAEVRAIARRLSARGMRLTDTHGSSGIEKCWYSSVEYERLAGVELIRNRIDMTAALGGDAVVLHPMVTGPDELDESRKQGTQSLKELEHYAVNAGVVLALENIVRSERTGRRDDGRQCFETIEYFFDRFSPEFVGFCWDTGHCLITGAGAMERAAGLARERLRVLHLNDNPGDWDQHSPPLTWKPDGWDAVAEAIADSPYPQSKPFVFEIDARNNGGNPRAFLQQVHEKALAFDELYTRVLHKRGGHRGAQSGRGGHHSDHRGGGRGGRRRRGVGE